MILHLRLPTNSRRTLLFATCLILSLFGRATASEVETALLERMDLMPEVAHYKRLHKLPVEDKVRENQVIEAGSRTAEGLGLEQKSSLIVLQALMQAAKEIQAEHWNDSLTSTPRDLNSVLREKINSSTLALLRALALDREGFQQDQDLLNNLPTKLRQRGVAPATIDALLSALRGLKRTAPTLQTSTLDFIRNRGVLRVGVTADFAPFSFMANDRLQGIDQDLAEALARSLEVELKTVNTTWSTLIDDLSNNRFDIAMTGISRQPFRQWVALFSESYFADGKGAIAPCALAKRFTTLAEIDRPEIRVLVNPGGTNERFVRANIQRARIALRPDNLSIFRALAEGEGDVMITDRVEAQWQSTRDPRLCVALSGGLLSQHNKGWLMPRDPIWSAYVNFWLDEIKQSGELENTITRYLPRRAIDSPPPTFN